MKSRGYQRIADYQVSTTDPDATSMRSKGGVDLGYHTHYVVDGGRARIILAALVTPSEVMDNQPMLDLLWRVRFRCRLWPRQVTGDRKYGTEENIVALERQHIRAYLALPDPDHRTPFFSSDQFHYVADRDIYLCPAGKELHFAPWHSTSDPCAIAPMAVTAIVARSRRSVPPANKDAASAAVSMRRCWIE